MEKPVDAVFLHCLRCMNDGTHQHLDVLLIDQELLVVACGSHTPPMHVCSVKIDPANAFVFTDPLQEGPPVGTA